MQPHQNSNSILHRVRKSNSQIHLEIEKKIQIWKTILNNKRTSEGISILDFKLYYRAKVIKTAWYWYSDRHVDQWNIIEDPKMNPHTYGHLIFDIGAKTIQYKKDIFNKWCWFNWQLACRRIQIDPFLSPCTMLKSTWIKDLHIKPETLKLIEKKWGRASSTWAQGNFSWTEHQYLMF